MQEPFHARGLGVGFKSVRPRLTQAWEAPAGIEGNRGQRNPPIRRDGRLRLP